MSLFTVPTTLTSLGVLINAAAFLAAAAYGVVLFYLSSHYERRRDRSTSPPCHSKEGSL
jgi:hypothetical protein